MLYTFIDIQQDLAVTDSLFPLHISTITIHDIVTTVYFASDSFRDHMYSTVCLYNQGGLLRQIDSIIELIFIFKFSYMKEEVVIVKF